MLTDSITTRRQAIAAVRAEADGIIEQLERRARGFDRGTWRDDVREVDRRWTNTIRATMRRSVAFAFALSRKFASADPAPAVEASPVAPLVDAGIVAPVALAGLPDGVEAFGFLPIPADDRLYAIDIARPGDSAPVRWYFDLAAQHAAALAYCRAHGITARDIAAADVLMPADDFITSADECVAWIRRAN